MSINLKTPETKEELTDAIANLKIQLALAKSLSDLEYAKELEARIDELQKQLKEITEWKGL